MTKDFMLSLNQKGEGGEVHPAAFEFINKEARAGRELIKTTLPISVNIEYIASWHPWCRPFYKLYPASTSWEQAQAKRKHCYQLNNQPKKQTNKQTNK